MKDGKETFFTGKWFGCITHGKLNQTLSRMIILNIALALLVIPSGICGQQHLTPIFDNLQYSWREPLTVCSVEDHPELFWEKNDLPAAAGDKATGSSSVQEAIRPPYDRYIIRAAEAYQVDPTLIKAVIMAESSYNPRAVSNRGAKGLMQLMPVTAKSLGVAEPFDPALNIDGGVRYLRQLLDRFEGKVDLALAAYNAGSRYVRKYDGVPPFRATRRYIKKVLELQRTYQQETAAEKSDASSV